MSRLICTFMSTTYASVVNRVVLSKDYSLASLGMLHLKNNNLECNDIYQLVIPMNSILASKTNKNATERMIIRSTRPNKRCSQEISFYVHA